MIFLLSVICFAINCFTVVVCILRIFLVRACSNVLIKGSKEACHWYMACCPILRVWSSIFVQAMCVVFALVLTNLERMKSKVFLAVYGTRSFVSLARIMYWFLCSLIIVNKLDLSCLAPGITSLIRTWHVWLVNLWIRSKRTTIEDFVVWIVCRVFCLSVEKYSSP